MSLKKKDQVAIAELYCSLITERNDPNSELGQYVRKEAGKILPWIGASTKGEPYYDRIFSVNSMDDPILDRYPQSAFFTTNHMFVDVYGNMWGPATSDDFKNVELYNRFLDIVKREGRLEPLPKQPAPKTSPNL